MRRRELIPVELRERDQWVLWRYRTHAGRVKKVPYQPLHPNKLASSTNPTTWSSFDQALAAFDKNVDNSDGIGFVFSPEDPYAGIDLDRCVLSDGRLHPAAAEIIRQLDSYTETSPSRTGVKIIVRAELPRHHGRSTKSTSWGDELAMHDQKRFFATTGRVLAGRDAIHSRQQQLEAAIASSFPSFTRPQPRAGRPFDIGDSELLDRAFSAQNGSKVRALYDGDLSGYSGDWSRADLALATILAFWTDSDADRIERMMRGSRLAREKWDRAWGDTTYLRRTIEKAVG